MFRPSRQDIFQSAKSTSVTEVNSRISFESAKHLGTTSGLMDVACKVTLRFRLISTHMSALASKCLTVEWLGGGGLQPQGYTHPALRLRPPRCIS
eukprot:4818298-Amphidinium_carterae.1